MLSASTTKLLGNWLIELKFYVPLNTKQVISEMFFTANLLAKY